MQNFKQIYGHRCEYPFIFFLELIKFYVFVRKITVLLETITRKMFYFIG